MQSFMFFAVALKDFGGLFGALAKFLNHLAIVLESRTLLSGLGLQNRLKCTVHFPVAILYMTCSAPHTNPKCSKLPFYTDTLGNANFKLVKGRARGIQAGGRGPNQDLAGIWEASPWASDSLSESGGAEAPGGHWRSLGSPWLPLGPGSPPTLYTRIPLRIRVFL